MRAWPNRSTGTRSAPPVVPCSAHVGGTTRTQLPPRNDGRLGGYVYRDQHTRAAVGPHRTAELGWRAERLGRREVQTQNPCQAQLRCRHHPQRRELGEEQARLGQRHRRRLERHRRLLLERINQRKRYPLTGHRVITRLNLLRRHQLPRRDRQLLRPQSTRPRHAGTAAGVQTYLGGFQAITNLGSSATTFLGSLYSSAAGSIGKAFSFNQPNLVSDGTNLVKSVRDAHGAINGPGCG